MDVEFCLGYDGMLRVKYGHVFSSIYILQVFLLMFLPTDEVILKYAVRPLC